MRGTIPPGGRVPLHSHGDVETFIVLAGEVDGLSGPEWVRVGPGDVFNVPAHVRHAWRNRSREPAEMLIVSTERIARFFREVAGPPSDAARERFLATAERYGYWNATPEQIAAIGVPQPEPSR